MPLDKFSVNAYVNLGDAMLAVFDMFWPRATSIGLNEKMSSISTGVESIFNDSMWVIALALVLVLSPLFFVDFFSAERFIFLFDIRFWPTTFFVFFWLIAAWLFIDSFIIPTKYTVNQFKKRFWSCVKAIIAAGCISIILLHYGVLLPVWQYVTLFIEKYFFVPLKIYFSGGPFEMQLLLFPIAALTAIMFLLHLAKTDKLKKVKTDRIPDNE